MSKLEVILTFLSLFTMFHCLCLVIPPAWITKMLSGFDGHYLALMPTQFTFNTSVPHPTPSHPASPSSILTTCSSLSLFLCFPLIIPVVTSSSSFFFPHPMAQKVVWPCLYVTVLLSAAHNTITHEISLLSVRFKAFSSEITLFLSLLVSSVAVQKCPDLQSSLRIDSV